MLRTVLVLDLTNATDLLPSSCRALHINSASSTCSLLAIPSPNVVYAESKMYLCTSQKVIILIIYILIS
ncbi:unnamed protein product [Cylicocyclus nassatus]|uniref:Uncharacterized protein n=1 Tax=Cylicocyclus nassatus TaxID=53992 RepID=A0AA36GZ41_CYLNA|nr:unnamed protein product [Cylicocyclus nassatus]